jgi:hypothetical protein
LLVSRTPPIVPRRGAAFQVRHIKVRILSWRLIGLEPDTAELATKPFVESLAWPVAVVVVVGGDTLIQVRPLSIKARITGKGGVLDVGRQRRVAHVIKYVVRLVAQHSSNSDAICGSRRFHTAKGCRQLPIQPNSAVPGGYR